MNKAQIIECIEGLGFASYAVAEIAVSQGLATYTTSRWADRCVQSMTWDRNALGQNPAEDLQELYERLAAMRTVQ